MQIPQFCVYNPDQNIYWTGDRWSWSNFSGAKMMSYSDAEDVAKEQAFKLDKTLQIVPVYPNHDSGVKTVAITVLITNPSKGL